MTDPHRPIAKKFNDAWGSMALAQYAANRDGAKAAEARRLLSDQQGYGLIFMAGEAWREWEGHVISEIEDLRKENRELRREQEELRQARESDGVTAEPPSEPTMAELLSAELKRLTAEDEPSDQLTYTDGVTADQTAAEPSTEPSPTDAPPWLVSWD